MCPKAHGLWFGIRWSRMPVYTLTDDIIKAAQRRADKEPKGDFEYIDRSNARLMIRVRNGKAAWSEKSRNGKARIAALDVFGEKDLPVLRQLVERIKTKRELGWTTEEINTMIAKFVAQPLLGVDHADNEANSVDWRWERLRDEFLDGPHGIKGHVPTTSLKNHRNFLGAIPGSVHEHDFEPLKNRVIKNLTQEHFDAVLDRIEARGLTPTVENKTRKRDGMYAARRLVRASIKAAFAWAIENQAYTGLVADPTDGLKPVRRERQEPEGLNPADIHRLTGHLRASPEEIRAIKAPRILFQREYIDPKEVNEFLLWLDEMEAKGTYQIEVIRILRIQVMSGQRISTVCRAIRALMSSVEDEEFTMVWYLGPDKNDKYRALPLPSYAGFTAKLACRAFDADEENLHRTLFLFPKSRHRKDGDNMNKSITKERPTAVIEDARKPGGPFHTSKLHITSHVFRAGLVSNLQNRWNLFGFSSDKATDMVTHEQEGQISTSQLYYNHDPNFEAKYHILKVWQDLVLMHNEHYDSTDIRAMLAKDKKAIRKAEEDQAALRMYEKLKAEGEI